MFYVRFDPGELHTTGLGQRQYHCSEGQGHSGDNWKEPHAGCWRITTGKIEGTYNGALNLSDMLHLVVHCCE